MITKSGQSKSSKQDHCVAASCSTTAMNSHSNGTGGRGRVSATSEGLLLTAHHALPSFLLKMANSVTSIVVLIMG